MKRTTYILLCPVLLVSLLLFCAQGVLAQEEIEQAAPEEKPILWDRLETPRRALPAWIYQGKEPAKNAKPGDGQETKIEQLERKVKVLEAEIKDLKKKCSFEDSSNSSTD